MTTMSLPACLRILAFTGVSCQPGESVYNDTLRASISWKLVLMNSTNALLSQDTRGFITRIEQLLNWQSSNVSFLRTSRVLLSILWDWVRGRPGPPAVAFPNLGVMSFF
jgi:hypothetical protein